MCVASMVIDHYRDKWNPEPWVQPLVITPAHTPPAITREEFDALKHDVLEMKELLKRAKKYDADNNEPDCEMEEKAALIRKIAEFVGVDLSEVLKPQA